MMDVPVAERLVMPTDPEIERNYIVCYATELVAEDISSGITEWDPGASVKMCKDPGELAAMLEHTASIRAVVASQSPSELSVSGVLRTLRDKGGQLIWLAAREDIATAKAHPNVVALDVPFTTETLHAALERLKQT